MASQPENASPDWRYRAFISYSHKDKAIALWLHRELERYRIPSKLVGTQTTLGKVPQKLSPIFRDQDELPASGNLGQELRDALANSLCLIVICSPAAAQSRWVNEEIRQFKMMHGADNVLAFIVDGEPNSRPEMTDAECFPPALRFAITDDGDQSAARSEPIAADVRKTADGKRLAKLKIVSGLTGLKLDDLVQRENARRIRALVQVSAASLMAMVFAVGLAIYANDRRLEAIEQRAVAEQESATARAVSDFLVNIFSSARSIETNPNAVTARSILDRGAQRVTVELEGQPEVKHRLSETIALAYNNLGLFDQAIDILNQTASLTDTAGASALSIKAEAHFRKGDLETAMDAIAQATRLLERLPREDSVQASARVQANTERIKALIHYQRGEHEKGLIAFERAILALETLPETEQLALANILQNRALLLSDMGEFTRAGNDLDKARTLVLANAGEKDILLGQIALARAQVDFLGGDIENALTQINRALEVMDRILEQDNPTLADALSMKGQILHAMGQLDDAEKALMASVDVYNNAYGGRHYLSGIAEVYLGLIAGEQNDLTKALMHFEEAKRHYDAGYGGVHPNHGDLLVNQAIVLAAFGDNEQAEENCAQGMSILNETLGESAAFTQQLQKVCDDINSGPE